MTTYEGIPVKALSIMQPWAWLIVNRYKPLENRDWATSYRGPVAIHAGKKRDAGAWRDVSAGYHPVTGSLASHFDHDKTIDLLGGIVGVADVVDCIDASDSDWFVGRYGFILANQRPVEFIPVKGALGFFDWRRNL